LPQKSGIAIIIIYCYTSICELFHQKKIIPSQKEHHNSSTVHHEQGCQVYITKPAYCA